MQQQQQQLYHRTNNKPGQQRGQEAASFPGTNKEKARYDEKKKNDDRRPSTARRTYAETSRRRSWTVKKTLQCLISMYIILSLSVYVVVVVVWKQEPSEPSIGPESTFDAEWWVSPNVTRAERILLVVAHPDDECLFFSPTLLNLLSPRLVNRTTPTTWNTSSSRLPDHSEPRMNSSTQPTLASPRAHILSLSSGNAEGLGIKRAREMRASCWAFGIRSSSCIVLDHPNLPDSKSVWWPEDMINEFVWVYVDLWNIDLIITFDHHGVSGHPNHRAIASALSRSVHTDPKFPTTMMLRSPGIIEKYSSLFGVPYTLYRHHRDRKSLLPQLARPPGHPSRDKKRLAELVLQTLIHLDAYHNLSSSSSLTSDNDTLSTASLSVTQETQNTSSSDPEGRRRRATASRLSAHNSLFIATPAQYWEARRAFNQHVSQQVWFRRLWLLTSRLMWLNELQRLVPVNDRFSDLPAFLSPSTAEQIVFPVKPPKLTSPSEKEAEKEQAPLVLSSHHHHHHDDDDRHISSTASNDPHTDSRSDPH
ncbi:N-acetylglucosaminyl-phosphatidylinositol de-N-acetylase [Puccinia graminis f. sp. tritici]|uniref:N-acetylglucosaminylphosphatidylinositol deacetylase n=1 Tax=Puccinia graminis f. sp. tritici TaxID=56615 RepID=A0A5B0RWC7_PUCGR|nr:N-acetylglucosaminyl-phosphatidylinositol de-N-acetylase [Puccinia graminis f. sp. tritici]